MKRCLCSRRRILLAVLVAPMAVPVAAAPIRLGPGPHLFIDDFLIEKSQGLSRTTHHPEKLPAPVLKKGEPWHQRPLFFMTVKFDAKAGTFQAWYNVLNHGLPPELVRAYAYAESKDGINWSRPELGLVSVNGSTRNNLIVTPPSNFGLFLVDDGPGGADPARRFKMAFFRGGLAVAFSPDGRRFTAHLGNPVIPQNANKIKPYAPGYENGISDIIDGCWDPLKKEYLLGCKIERGGYPGKPHYHAEGWRRCVAVSTSKDFIKWEKPHVIVTPDPNNGIEEFYGFKPTLRGDLYLGFVRVLRDDLPADKDGPVNGIGWTELLTSRDGRSWTRHPGKFLGRNRSAGSWDHAMAWLADCVTVGDKDYIYYGGYSAGHKVGDRQIGLALLRKNGFVSRDAGERIGTLRTPAVVLMGKTLTVNARVKGTLRVRLTGVDGAALPGFDWTRIAPAGGDSVAHPIAWTGGIASLSEKPVHIECELTQAELYGFDVIGPDAQPAGLVRMTPGESKVTSPSNAANRGCGITGVTKGPVALQQPPDLPSTEEESRYGQRRYGLGFPMQVGPTTAALLVNRRCEGGADFGDFEDGSDAILFDGLRSVSAKGAVPVVRNEIVPDPGTGRNRVFVAFPARGGFVPLGARRADGTPHPHAGTGFCISPALGYLLTERHKRIQPDPMKPETSLVVRTRLHQLSFDGKQLRVVDQSLPPGKSLWTEDSRWRLAYPGMTMAIPDSDDLLLPVNASGKGHFCGVARWARRSGAWRLASFMPVQETERLKISMEPSLARDVDGSLLLTARKGDRTQEDAFALRVWRSRAEESGGVAGVDRRAPRRSGGCRGREGHANQSASSCWCSAARFSLGVEEGASRGPEAGSRWPSVNRPDVGHWLPLVPWNGCETSAAGGKASRGPRRFARRHDLKHGGERTRAAAVLVQFVPVQDQWLTFDRADGQWDEPDAGDGRQRLTRGVGHGTVQLALGHTAIPYLLGGVPLRRESQRTEGRKPTDTLRDSDPEHTVVGVPRISGESRRGVVRWALPCAWGRRPTPRSPRLASAAKGREETPPTALNSRSPAETSANSALDRLLETALSTPGIMEDYGEPTCGK